MFPLRVCHMWKKVFGEMRGRNFGWHHGEKDSYGEKGEDIYEGSGGILILDYSMTVNLYSEIACTSTSFLLGTSAISRNLMTVKEFDSTTT